MSGTGDVRVGTPLGPKLIAAQAKAAKPKPNGADRPAAPTTNAQRVPGQAPARPTLIERMKTEIVPFDELIAAKGELEALAKADEDRYKVERAETDRALAELRKIRREFRPILEGARGDARKGIIAQIEARKQIVAAALGEREMKALDGFDRLDELIEGYGEAAHFGNFGYVLRGAEKAGFLGVIDQPRYDAEVAQGRKHLVFSHRGVRYFPLRFDSWKLSRTLAWEIRRLYFRCIETADREHAVEYGLLESGKLPESKVVLRLLGVDKSAKSLTKPFVCGVVLVDLPIRDQRDQKLHHYNGVAQVAFFDHDGKRHLGIAAVSGGARQALRIESAPVSLRRKETTAGVCAVVRHLLNVANGMLLTENEVAALNANIRKARGVEDLQPEGEDGAAQRAFRFAELRGDEWRRRNSRWLERRAAELAKRPTTKVTIPPVATEAAANALANALMPHAK